MFKGKMIYHAVFFGLMWIPQIITAGDESDAIKQTVPYPKQTMASSSQADSSQPDSINQSQQETVPGTILKFLEEESGHEPYAVTYTITQKWLRIDDTLEKNNFVLLDRTKQIIYSVNQDDKQVYQIESRSIGIKSPIKISHQIKIDSLDANTPTIDDQKAQKFQFMVNNQPCVEMVTIKGLLKQELKVLLTFKKIMAGQHAKHLSMMPFDSHDACDLSKNIFNPGLFYSEGFPIIERDKSKSYTRILTNYQQNKRIDKRLFVVPNGLTYIKM